MKKRNHMNQISAAALMVILAISVCTGVAHADMGVPSVPLVFVYLAICCLPAFLVIVFTFLLIASFCAQLTRNYDVDGDEVEYERAEEQRKLAKEKGKRFRAVVGTMDLVSLSSTAWWLYFKDVYSLVAVIIFVVGLAFTKHSSTLYRRGEIKESKRFLVMVCIASVVMGLIGYFIPEMYAI